MELTSCNFEEPSCFKEELACYVSREINNEKQVKPITKPTSIWEHEDLAKASIFALQMYIIYVYAPESVFGCSQREHLQHFAVVPWRILLRELSKFYIY